MKHMAKAGGKCWLPSSENKSKAKNYMNPQCFYTVLNVKACACVIQ